MKDFVSEPIQFFSTQRNVTRYLYTPLHTAFLATHAISPWILGAMLVRGVFAAAALSSMAADSPAQLVARLSKQVSTHFTLLVLL